MSAALAWLGSAARMSDAVFASRHRVLRIVLWIHVPVLVIIALLTRTGTGGNAMEDMPGMAPSTGQYLVWTMIAAVFLSAMASGITRTRRTGAIAVSVGLTFAAAALVHAGGGLT